MLIDTHAHIADSRFDANDIVKNMTTDKLQNIICVGFDYDCTKASFALAQKHKQVYCSLGIHPNYSSDYKDEYLQEFLLLSQNEKVVAIGELGLDYHYDNTDKKQQLFVLEKQLELASQAALPVIVHMRDCDDDMQKVLFANRSKLKNGGVMHCYSASLESAKKYLHLGFYISFSGSITFKNAKRAPEIIKSIPLNKILVETDCPYLAPEPHRGQQNYPKFVVHTAQKIADILDLPLEKVAEFTTKNALKLFSKMRSV